MRKNSLKIKFIVSLAALSLVSFQSCKQRDDWPVFDVTPKMPDDQIVVVDNDKTWYVETLESKGNTFFKTFIRDSILTLGAGITYASIQFIDGLDQVQLIHIVEADLNNPNVGVVSMTPFGEQFPNLQVLSAMAKDNDGKGGKIIAAINGDNWAASTTNAYGNPSNGFVNFGKVMKGWVNSTTNITRPYLAVKKSGEVFIGNTQNNTTSPFVWIEQTEFEHQVSGPTWVNYAAWLNTANTDLIVRSFVGINEAENKLYFVVNEGKRPGTAIGIGAPNMARLLKDFGINKSFMPYFSQYGQLALRKEETLNGFNKVTFPLVNTPTTSQGLLSVGTLANGIAIISKK